MCPPKNVKPVIKFEKRTPLMCLTKRENPVWDLTCLPPSMNKSIACSTGYILSSIAILTYKPHVSVLGRQGSVGQCAIYTWPRPR